MKIIVDDLQEKEIFNLLNEHLQDMYSVSPPESVHALDIKALQGPNITFWSVWVNEKLAGCGAIKELGSNQAEIKSMRTSLGLKGSKYFISDQLCSYMRLIRNKVLRLFLLLSKFELIS